MENFADFSKIAGFVFGIVAMVGGIIVRDRNISNRIIEGDSKIHVRLDDMKDDLNENFARKDDVKESIRRVERQIETINDNIDRKHESIINLLMKREK